MQASSGLLWIGIRQVLGASWFFSRLCLLLAIISFVPAGLVVLIHGRSFGRFFWWDRSNAVLAAHRSPRVEKTEFVLMAALWTIIFGFVIVMIFVLSR